jgi:hypothetical protein
MAGQRAERQRHRVEVAQHPSFQASQGREAKACEASLQGAQVPVPQCDVAGQVVGAGSERVAMELRLPFAEALGPLLGDRRAELLHFVEQGAGSRTDGLVHPGFAAVAVIGWPGA